MKRIVSVSIGSSTRDKSIEIELLGEKYHIQRIGTNGSIREAIEMIKELDGKIDAFGMGGIDLYLSTGINKRFIIKDAISIKEAAKITPIVDGTGVKNTLEKKVVKYLNDNNIIDFKNKKVLVTCAADRLQLAEGFVDCGCKVVLGDFIFALGIPIPIHSIRTYKTIANAVMPVVSRLPFEILYPTGKKQEANAGKKFSRYYHEADIIAGDYHYIRKYIPDDMNGKIIVTNTVTMQDVDLLKEKGVSMLITTTPKYGGRSFGTNVVEAMLVAASDKKSPYLDENDYYRLLEKLDIKPRIEYLN